MKHFFTLLMIILFANLSQAQNNDYSELWQQVEKFETEGLPKSALEIVEQISTKAEADQNAQQQVKVLLFQSKFALTLEEDAQLKIINEFKFKIANSSFPTTHILENVLANLFWQYFQQNRWRFYNRTNTDEKVDAEDFRTWDLQTLFDEVHLHYQKSLQNGLLLQQEDLVQFDDILNKQKGSKTFRPTLFDFLAHNALEFYKTDENSITKPAYKFEIDNPSYLSDASSFSKLNIVSKDSSSLQLNALKIYQDLIQFHVKDSDPYALADVNIQRLQYVRQHATLSDKDALLIETLKTESNRQSTHEVSGLYDFEIANVYYQQGLTFQAQTNTDVQWKLKDAFELCETISNKFPNSKAAQKCMVLRDQILQQSLQITSEAYLSILTNSKILIRYKNLSRLKFTAFQISRNQLIRFQKIYRKKEQLAFIKKLKTETKWGSELRDEGDFQSHSTEVLLPPLKNGFYLIFAEPNDKDEQAFAFASIQVSNLALVNKVDDAHQVFQLFDRNNGRPMVNAQVTLKFKNNNLTEKTENTSTDLNGEFKILKSKTEYWQLDIEAEADNDKAFFDNYYLNRYYPNSRDNIIRYRSFIFTDRSIYRPGQTVYFKGIMMENKDGKSEVVDNNNGLLTLHDVNNQKIAEFKYETNEYGSYSGQFILPNNGLSGIYHLKNAALGQIFSDQTFSVEEYKRPKFEAKFNPVTETFKIDDSITVKGTAIAYAGSNITDAKVVYRVHRKVQYPRWYYWYRPWYSSEPQEISHGETLTNAQGEFEIIFRAIPDQSVDAKSLPIFKYEIIADITDINGETRSARTIVNLGYHAMTLTAKVESKLDKSIKDHRLNIVSRNLNGEFVPSKGTIKMYKLQAPNKVMRPRPWNAPDYAGFSEEEFKALFPHEAYKNEDDSNFWKKGKLVYDKHFDTSVSKDIDLGNMKRWDSGLYIILLESRDKFGQLVREQLKTTLVSRNDKTASDHKLFNYKLNQLTYSEGDNVILKLASAANITITVDIEKNKQTVETHLLRLNNNSKTLYIPVTKEDIGGFAISYSYAAFNSFQSGTLNISVPYPKTELKIETLTFRDKLKPGQEEAWSFKIKGPKSDKVSAELLISMYDLSLDQFKPHKWNFNPIDQQPYYSNQRRNAQRSFGLANYRIYIPYIESNSYPYQGYDQFNWFGFNFGNRYYNNIRGLAAPIEIVEDAAEVEEVVVTAQGISKEKKALGFSSTNAPENDINGILSKEDSFEDTSANDLSSIQIRKNLQETAFFFPHLQTDEEGNVSFSFTTPEALTKWKVQLLAHTKTLESATSTLETVTQKELMVIPNAPRFLREGDKIVINSKIANISDKNLSGEAVLQLFDATNGQKIDAKLDNVEPTKRFSVDALNNTNVSWSLSIPYDIQAVQYKIIAMAGDFSDGEQNALPVLSNRMLVTESMPMWIRSNQSKTFTLDKLKTYSSTTLKHHNLTLEMTSNPAWYAVQALPYLMEYPYDCNEQTFARFYANALATHIANSNPRIQEVFNQWKNTDALLSNLEKNQELKSLLIQETPWLRDAQSETEQKKRIGLLFDLNKMNNEMWSSLQKLQNNQMSNGAWPWFNGGRSNRNITQHIVAGFTHLENLKDFEINDRSGTVISIMRDRALSYLDKEFVKEYKDIRKYNKDVDLSKDHLSSSQLQYLYIRSFLPDLKVSKEIQEIINYYHSQIKSYWLKRSLYQKGLMALIMHRSKDNETSIKILNSLKENSITSEEMGMYWKDNTSSWYWYQAPIETQALLIEAFSEIENDVETIDNLKIWLLKNKQTNRWKSTKATTEAIYALLLQGSKWLSITEMVDIVIGNETIDPQKLEDVKVEAGSGYFKTSWSSSEIKPEMANVSITKKGDGIAWGSLYWQYFEDLDKITSAETLLKLEKKLFLKSNTDKGEELSEITTDSNLNVGDLVRVRIELRSDRAMEFVHMKDMRASGLEPLNVLSIYKYQDGLGYYESTKDASTNFFFDYLPKGVYVFEYDLRVNNLGNFSNGITTIQSMYAPEFSSHSEGIRIQVD